MHEKKIEGLYAQRLSLIHDVLFGLLVLAALALAFVSYLDYSLLKVDMDMLNIDHLTYLGRFSVLGLLFDGWSAIGLTGLFNLIDGWEYKHLNKWNIWKFVLSLSLVLGRTTAFWWSFILALIPDVGSPYLMVPIKIIIPFFVLVWSGVVNILALYFFIMAAVLSLVFLPIKIFNAVFQIKKGIHIANVLKEPFFGTVLICWYWLIGRKLPKEEALPDESKGARFATNEEIKASIDSALKQKNNAVFGWLDKTPLTLENEKHTLIMASTRSGKGVSLIIPHLLRYEGSAFVLDPKGENARATGRQRKKLNKKAHFLDPFGISGKPKSRFNPLSRFTPENMEEESKALANALIMGEHGQRDHWTGSAQQLLAALILYIYNNPHIPKEKKDLRTTREILLRKIHQALAAMVKCPFADGLVANLGASFLSTPENELGSIISTAQRETEILDNPSIIGSLSASGEGEEVNFSEWHKGTMTVYLCLAAPKFPVFNRWLRLVLTSALNEMTDRLKPPPLPVCFMLDELATLGHLNVVENAIGLAAGYGVHLWTIFQDIAQMKDLYRGRWASFIGNSGVKALFNLDDYDTAKYWSNFIGGRLVESRSEQQDIYGLSKGQSMGETMRPLISPEKIILDFAGKFYGNAPKTPKMMVLTEGAHPIITDRVPYYHDESLKGLWDDPRM
jgi:type IV secretion system protein VirD4